MNRYVMTMSAPNTSMVHWSHEFEISSDSMAQEFAKRQVAMLAGIRHLFDSVELYRFVDQSSDNAKLVGIIKLEVTGRVL